MTLKQWTKRDADFWQGYKTFMTAPNEAYAICEREKKKKIIECETKKSALNLKGQRLAGVEYELTEAVNKGGGLPAEFVLLADRRRGFSLLFLTILLLCTSYALVLWSLLPFELGNLTYIVSLGISLALTIAFERVLNLLSKLLTERYNLIWHLFVVLGASVFAATAITYLALIRNDLVRLIMLHGQGSPEYEGAVRTFYDQSLRILRMVFPLITLGLDLVAAICLHGSISKLSSSAPALKVLRRLNQIRGEMQVLVEEIKELDALPEKFEISFLNGVAFAKEEERKKAEIQEFKEYPERELKPEDIEQKRARNLSLATLIFIGMLVFGIILVTRSYGNELNTICVDLTGSMMVKDPQGISEFEKNLIAIEKRIKRLNPGSIIKIHGITDQSFGSPLVLLEGKVNSKPGYFGQNALRDVNSLLAKWKTSMEKIQANAKVTDVLGMLCLVESVFNGSKSVRKNLFLYSDMRHSKGVNLEKPEIIDIRWIDAAKKLYGVPNFEGVQIYVYGAHGYGKSQAYWNSLKQFWEEFFRQTKGELKIFSPLQEVSDE